MKFHAGDAAFSQDTVGVFFDMLTVRKGYAHHPQAADLALGRLFDTAAGFQHKFLADPGHAGIYGMIPFPPAAECEGAGCDLIGKDVFPPFQSDRFSQLQGDSQLMQSFGIQCDLIFLLRHMSGFGIGEVVLCVLIAGIADLHLPSAQPFIFRQAQDNGAAVGSDIWVRRKQFNLLIGDLLGGSMGFGAGLPQVHFRNIFSQALRQRE